jgi:hypothetical protein
MVAVGRLRRLLGQTDVRPLRTGLLAAVVLLTACSGGSTNQSSPTTQGNRTPTTVQPTTTTACAQAAVTREPSGAGFRSPSAFGGCIPPPVGFEVPATLANAVQQNAIAHPSVFYGGRDITGVICTQTSPPIIGGPNGGNPDYTFTCDVEHADHSVIAVQVMVSPDGSQWGAVG